MKKPTHTEKALSPLTKSSLVNVHSAFTIVELVVVIGIMALLLAIALPTIKSVRLAAERKKATIQATLLTQAVIKYKDIYGFWPGQLVVTDDAGSATPKLKLRESFQDMDWTPLIISRFGNPNFKLKEGLAVYIDENHLYRALNVIDPDPENKEGVLCMPNPLNPKQIEFMKLEQWDNKKKTGVKDPWGQEYIVFMGMSPNLTYTSYIEGTNIKVYTVSNTTAFALSLGQDMEKSEDDIIAAGVNHERY